MGDLVVLFRVLYDSIINSFINVDDVEKKLIINYFVIFKKF